MEGDAEIADCRMLIAECRDPVVRDAGSGNESRIP
jgi:hypothetical protein